MLRGRLQDPVLEADGVLHSGNPDRTPSQNLTKPLDLLARKMTVSHPDALQGGAVVVKG